jgi:hypothetical protein
VLKVVEVQQEPKVPKELHLKEPKVTEDLKEAKEHKVPKEVKEHKDL